MEAAKKIQHLYARAGFGLSPAEWSKQQEWPIKQAIEDLFQPSQRPAPLTAPALVYAEERMQTPANRNDIQQEERQLVAGIGMAWLARMANPSEAALLERMCLFWHGHFACDIRIGLLAGQYLNTLRQHALGNFRDLVLAVAHDPAMIRYLNNQQNRKEQPNENFARELMELFTIGRGNYSEQDVKEAARAFTGWSSDRTGAFVFRRLFHDFDTKTFLGRSGNFDGADIVDILLEKKETARFVCRKIYRYFINDQADDRRVEELTEVFFKDYDIGGLMRYIFESEWFYDPRNIGSKIKSPVELIAGLMRQLNASFGNPAAIIGVHRALGQVLFHPPNVAGWPGGKNWIDNSTLTMRLQLPAAFCLASEVDFTLKTELDENERRFIRRLETDVDFEPVMALCRPLSADEYFKTLSGFFILPDVRWSKSTVEEDIGIGSPEDRIRFLSIRLMSLPEYQMC